MLEKPGKTFLSELGLDELIIQGFTHISWKGFKISLEHYYNHDLRKDLVKLTQQSIDLIKFYPNKGYASTILLFTNLK